MAYTEDGGDDVSLDEETMALLELFAPHTHRIAVEVEAMLRYGQSIGLTGGEVHEVIDTWHGWYSCTPWPLSWDKVRDSVARRAKGEPWGPPSGAEATPAGEGCGCDTDHCKHCPPECEELGDDAPNESDLDLMIQRPDGEASRG